MQSVPFLNIHNMLLVLSMQPSDVGSEVSLQCGVKIYFLFLAL